MGRDKALLPVEGSPMIHRMADLLRTVTGREPVLLGPRARYGELGLAVVEDGVDEAGPLAGLVAMLASESAGELNVVLPVDMPGLEPGFVLSWIDFIRVKPELDAVVPLTTSGLAPLSAVYRRRAGSVLAREFARGTRRVRQAIEALHVGTIEATPEQLANLNTPEDWARHNGRDAGSGDLDEREPTAPCFNVDWRQGPV